MSRSSRHSTLSPHCRLMSGPMARLASTDESMMRQCCMRSSFRSLCSACPMRMVAESMYFHSSRRAAGQPFRALLLATAASMAFLVMPLTLVRHWVTGRVGWTNRSTRIRPVRQSTAEIRAISEPAFPTPTISQSSATA